jgi:DNA polymerase
MVKKTSRAGSAAAFLPERPTLPALRAAAAGCTACDLWRIGTQTVFGEGRAHAAVMFVGEQPGNEEDLSGHPFVGPAGRLLDRALEAAGIDRSAVYVTNAVKHFKWELRGTRRLHVSPNTAEKTACRPWLEAEIAVVKPRIIVCLGATAAQSLLGPQFRVTKQRGEFVESPYAPHVMATVHPSALLRIPDEETRHAEMDRFVNDLRKIVPLIASPGEATSARDAAPRTTPRRAASAPRKKAARRAHIAK